MQTSPEAAARAAQTGRERTHATLVALAIGGAAASLVFVRLHSGEVKLAQVSPTDLANYYYPVAELVGRRLAAGELPLWNPFSCSGTPLLAALQPAVLHPTTWLAAWLPTAQAMLLALWLQIALAAMLTAAALRAGGLHPVASGLGGLFYAQACLLGSVAWPPAVGAMAWFPALWLCVEKLAAAPRFRWWLLLAVVTALQLLAGFPQYVVYGFYWLGPYALLRLFEVSREHAAPGTPRPPLVRRAAWMVLALCLGFGLAGVQLLPTAELARQSSRAQALSADEIHYLEASTRPAAQLVANAVDPRPRNPTFDLGSGTGYLGIASVLALVAALARTLRRPTTLSLLAAGALALLLSDGFRGPGAPLFALYHELPTGGLFRTPERLRFLYVVSLLVLASRGLDALLRDPGDGRSRRLLVALAATAVGVAVLGESGAAWRAAGALALSAGLLLGPGRKGLRSLHTGLAAGWVLLTVVDLWLATAPSGALHDYPPEVSERYRAPSRGGWIVPAEMERLKALPDFVRVEPIDFLPHHAAGPAFGLYRSTCYEPLAPGQWRALHETLLPDDPARGPIANPPPRSAPTFYDVASVGVIVLPTQGRSAAHPNPDALPRAYLVESSRFATAQEAYRHIRDGSFDFHRGVLLEDAAVSDEPDASRARAAPRQVQSLPPARIVRYEPEAVEIEVAPERDAWLVLTDTFHPGWEARVDGAPAPILRANGLYRAVRVSAGSQRVGFEYRPMSLRAGLAVSLLSALAVAVLAWQGGRRGWLR
jgi:hypothetical protein